MNDEQLQKAWNKMMEDIRKVPEHELLESIEDKVNDKLNKVIHTFKYNPDHTIGTCSKCGEEMLFNVPRIGRDGGYIHKSTGKFSCKEVDKAVEALKQLPSQGFEDYDPKDFVPKVAKGCQHWRCFVEVSDDGSKRSLICPDCNKLIETLEGEAVSQKVNMYGEVIPQYPFDTSS